VIDLFAAPAALPLAALPPANSQVTTEGRPQIERGPSRPVARVLLIEFEARGVAA
jgi:hypothetical protein